MKLTFNVLKYILLLIVSSHGLCVMAQGQDAPLVRCIDRHYVADGGLDGRHIALWNSHGLYYELGNARWEWQRARMFETVEDKLTSAYVLQYVVPMLENAGANVLLPRERDVNPYEVIVDNDHALAVSPYHEHNGRHPWQTGEGRGFALKKREYRDFDNPFTDGTYRMARTVDDERLASTISWIPEIPEEREYAVYVSYKTVENSTTAARYTVYHKGGTTTFLVNQQMGGGTWIYLGTFLFAKGKEGKVVLSNLSLPQRPTPTAQTSMYSARHFVTLARARTSDYPVREGEGDTAIYSGQDDQENVANINSSLFTLHSSLVTADAVRFGGGMGNIARGIDGTKIYDNTKIKKNAARAVARNRWQPTVETSFEVSGYPRFMEGSRYYLQWAGMPRDVYTCNSGNNDYMDDFKSRGPWVNYLCGGSRSWPSGKGLNIPIDLSMAVHTDGESVAGDNIIGTLGIYHVNSDGARFGDGTSRLANSQLCNGVYNSILNDVRRLVEPRWTGRGCSDRDYNEAAIPKVPALLMELFSHESFGEMRYGLDPRFQFIVGRAIYKGILRFLAKRNGYDYVVQPLPVEALKAEFDEEQRCVVSWKAVVDSIEPTAVADSFIVYRRVGDGGFDNGTVVADTSYTCVIPRDEVVSFKVTAINRGGQSMDSEIVSVGLSSQALSENRKPVLIINGFNRVSAPDYFVDSNDREAGFLADQDNGVPYRSLITYVGKQKEFRRSVRWTDDDSPGFGASYGNEERYVIAGNTFDYPALHGSSLLKAGWSFVSASRLAVKDAMNICSVTSDSASSSTPSSLCNATSAYSAVDVILGKQKQTRFGRSRTTYANTKESDLSFKTFDQPLQQFLTDYCKAGGRVFVSGAYVATDLWQNPLIKAKDSDKRFARNILKYQWRTDKAACEGKVSYVPSAVWSKSADGGSRKSFTYYNKPDAEGYAVESPDAIIPADSNTFPILRYSENGLCAGVCFGGTDQEPWRTVVLGFPFESIKEQGVRDEMMKNVMKFLIPPLNLPRGGE